MTKKLFVMQRENMKYQSVAKRITYGLSGLVLSLASLVLVPAAAHAQATTGTFTATVSGSKVAKGDQFTVEVKAAANVPISIVQAYVTFDATKVSYTSIDYTGSPWTQDTGDTGAGKDFYQISNFKRELALPD